MTNMMSLVSELRVDPAPSGQFINTRTPHPEPSASCAKYRSADANNCCALFNRDLEIVRHAHRKLAARLTECSLTAKSISQFAQLAEKRPHLLQIFRVGWQRHKSD